jgi:hypothetical protein
MAIGNFSLVLGLLLRMFVHPAGANQGWFDAALGLFFGISIGINLFVLRFGGRCGDAEAKSS